MIEITEHEFVPDDDSLQATVADLRERGALIAIDDAGAGHAGLKQLMRVRPDIVKLDRALIRDIHTDPARMALVESFVRFARDVGATVCAEGIESLDELAVIADLDVQWGQGYALARPAPPWAGIAPEAAELCRAALAETFRSMPAERQPARLQRPPPRPRERQARRRPHPQRPRERPGPDRGRARGVEDLPLGLARRRVDGRDARRERRAQRRDACSRSTTTRSARTCCASRRRSRCWSATPTPTRGGRAAAGARPALAADGPGRLPRRERWG